MFIGGKMEKTKNGYYTAVSILCFVIGGFSIISAILGLIGVMGSEQIFFEIYNEYLAELGDATLAQEYTDLVKTLTYAIFVISLIGAIPTIIEGIVFNKLKEIDDKTAYEKYGYAMGWSIAGFFFGGILIGGLALAGLLSVQKGQKDRYKNSTETKNAFSQQSNNGDTFTQENSTNGQSEKTAETQITLEELDKIQSRLTKLQELKTSGALSDEEYENLRAQIVSKINQK